MKDNIFINLLRYRPRPERNPEEDFFTEAFAWFLRNINGLGRHIFEDWIKQKRQEIVIDIPEENLDIKTQVDLGLFGRADMIINTPKVQLLFEHKIQQLLSVEDNNQEVTKTQLDKYLKYAKEEKDNKCFVFLITKYSSDNYQLPNKNWDGFHRWQEVYLKIKSFNPRPEYKILLQNLVGIMEELNMDPFKKITDKDIEAVDSFLKFWGKSEKLLEAIGQRIKKERSDLTIGSVAKGGWSYWYRGFVVERKNENIMCYLIWLSGEIKIAVWVFPASAVNKNILGNSNYIKCEYAQWKGKICEINIKEMEGFMTADEDKQIGIITKFFLNEFKLLFPE